MKLLKKLLGTDKVLDSVGNIIDDLVTTKEEKIQAKTKLKEIILNHQAQIESNITDRWKADMNSDSWLSKNVRPLTLIFMLACTMSLIFIDAGYINFQVKPHFADLLQIVLITIVASYFGGRSVEKLKK